MQLSFAKKMKSTVTSKFKISPYVPEQAMTIAARPLKNDCDYRRSRLSREFADAGKEKSVAGHRVIHARSG